MVSLPQPAGPACLLPSQPPLESPKAFLLSPGTRAPGRGSPLARRWSGGRAACRGGGQRAAGFPQEHHGHPQQHLVAKPTGSSLPRSIWIPEVPRATEFSGSDCREQVEGQEEGPFPIESKMLRIPRWCPGNHPAPGETGAESSTPVEVVRVGSHRGERVSTSSYISSFFLLQNNAACRGLGSNPTSVT